jgi:hypothetical protein
MILESTSNVNIHNTHIANSSVSGVFADTGSSPRFYNCTLFSIPGSYLDIAVANDGEQNVVHLGNGDGTVKVTPSFGTGSDATSSITMGYLNGDGYLDMVVGNNGEQNVVYMGKGDGTFDSESYNFGTGSDATTCVVLGDMNDDTVLDIVVGNDGEQNVIYLGDGDGTFDTTSYNFGTGSDATTCIALGNLDGDSDIDIVIGNYGERNEVYHNQGGGTFVLVDDFGGFAETTTSLSLGDMDDEGDLDLVVGNYGGQNRAYMNSGSFLLSDNFGTGTDATTTVIFNDADYDTYLDIIVGNNGEQNVIYKGDGDGTFDTTYYNFGTGSDATTSIAVGDVNDDWVNDIVVGNVGEQNQVYFGEFPIGFSTYHNFGTGSDATSDIALGEVNNYENDFYIAGDSHPWLLNTTFNKTATAYLDTASNLTAYWYMHANVVDVYYTGVASASLWINDTYNTPVLGSPFTTDIEGWVRWMVATEYVENATDGKTYKTSHNASAREGARFGHVFANMNTSKSVIIILDGLDLPIPLKKGWNLISIPMNLSTTNLVDVLAPISGKYSAVQWYDANDPSDFWKHHHIEKPPATNDLTDIDRLMGIWILMDSDAVLPLTGFIPLPLTTSIELKTGWNLVGYPSITTRTAGNETGDAFESIAGFVDMVQYYDASDGADPWKAWDYGTYSPDDLVDIKPKMGLWIHVTGDCTWTVNW